MTASVPQVQRICASGGELPRRLLVDVVSVEQWGADVACDPWPTLNEALQRSTRRAVLVGSGSNSSDVPMVRTDQPLAGLLSVVDGQRVGIVTAQVEEQRSKLYVLAPHDVVLLDIGTGRLWSRATMATADEGYRIPAVQPLLDAICVHPTERPYGTRRAETYRPQLEAAMAVALARTRRLGRALSDLLVESVLKADVPKWLVEAVGRNRQRVLEMEQKLRAHGPVDLRAQAELRAWIWTSNAAAPLTQATQYVVAETRRDDGELVLERLLVRDGHARPRIARGKAAMRLLRGVPCSGRWFVPRALELLDVMVDADLPLPEKVVDPGLARFVLHPDDPPRLDTLGPTQGLQADVVAWLEDHRRENAVAPDLTSLVDVAPELDEQIATVLDNNNLGALIEDDIGRTLPALARIERLGGAHVDVPMGFSGWDGLRDELEAELAKAEERVVRALGDRVDVHARHLDQIVDVLHGPNPLPRSYAPARLTSRQMFDRYVHHKIGEAPAIETARSLLRTSIPWARQLATTTRLRGLLVPTKTGRWTFRKPPIHSLIKRAPFAKEIRSALYAPPGMTLVGVDYNGEEVRLLAALSQSTALLEAARGADIHGEIAQLLFGDRRQRTRAKAAVLPFLYSQSKQGFCANQAALSTADAEALFDLTSTTFADVAAFKRVVNKKWKSVITQGGWRRFAPNRRKAFNTIIQGLGGDLLRWVIRTLDRELERFGSYIVHIAHDEVIVACLPDDVKDVAKLIVEVMTTRVENETGLLSCHVLKVNKPKVGRTWADLM